MLGNSFTYFPKIAQLTSHGAAANGGQDWFSGVLAVDLPMKCNPDAARTPGTSAKSFSLLVSGLTKTGADQ
jgi:hypothetical protein